MKTIKFKEVEKKTYRKRETIDSNNLSLLASKGYRPLRTIRYMRHEDIIVEGIKLKHGFFQAFHTAFIEHQTIRIKPDYIWLLITQGISVHEEKTGFFGNLFKLPPEDNKKEIEVHIGPSINRRAFEENGLPRMIQAIEKEVPKNLFSSIYEEFSTTGIVERACFGITLMNSLKRYYHFSMRGGCYLPEIKILGTKEDWVKILENVKVMRKFFVTGDSNKDLTWWFNALVPLLEEFVNVYDGKINREFWDSAYGYKSTVVMMSMTPINEYRVTGWLAAFIPYVFRYNSAVVNYGVKWNEIANKKYNKDTVVMKPEELPSGIRSVDIKFTNELTDETEELTFYGGFIGVKQCDKTLDLEPSLFWALAEKEKKQ